MYNYGYKEVMPITLDEINELVENTKEEYKLKIFLPKAILEYMGVKD